MLAVDSLIAYILSDDLRQKSMIDFASAAVRLFRTSGKEFCIPLISFSVSCENRKFVQVESKIPVIIFTAQVEYKVPDFFIDKQNMSQ